MMEILRKVKEDRNQNAALNRANLKNVKIVKKISILLSIPLFHFKKRWTGRAFPLFFAKIPVLREISSFFAQEKGRCTCIFVFFGIFLLLGFFVKV